MFMAGQIIPDPERSGEHVLVVSTNSTGGVIKSPFLTVSSGSTTLLRSVHRDHCVPNTTSPTPVMRRLAFSVGQSAKAMEEIQSQNQALDTEHAAKLDQIRTWLVSLHEDDRLNREDLDEMLAKFDMEPYSRRYVGRVFIEVSLVVDDARDLDQAEQHAYDWAEKTLVDTGGDENISSPGITTMTYKLEPQRFMD